MAPVRVQVGGEDAAVVRSACAVLRFEDQRACAIAEQHTGGPVCPVHDPAECLGPDHHNAFCLARQDQRVGIGQRIGKPGADRLKVIGKATGHAEVGLYHGRGRGKGQIGGRGGQHDGVDVVALEARRVQRRLRRPGGKVRGGFAFGGEMAPLDARARPDPFVGRVKRGFELGILDDPFGQVMPHADHHRTSRHVCSPVALSVVAASASLAAAAMRAATLSLKPARAS